MSTSPQLVVTNAGLAAAEVATPTGPFIHITRFRIGSGSGYDPTATDLDLNGSLLYTGVPSTYKYMGDNTLNIICKIPADVGPFDFGELALDLDGPVMFAKAVWPTTQKKYTSLGTNVLSTYTFNCLLKLAQPVAIFKIDTLAGDPPSIWEVDLWSDVYPPAQSANPDIPAILVKELDQNGNATLLTQASEVHWTVSSNYRLHAAVPAGGGDVNHVTVSVSNLGIDALSTTPREFLVQLEDGYIRPCSSVDTASGYFQFHAITPFPNAPETGSRVLIYTNKPTLGPTNLVLAGDVRGSAIIQGGNVTLNAVVSQTSVRSRSATFDAAGIYHLPIPLDVDTIYLDGAAAGGGGGGAGGGWNTDHVVGDDYKGGGGGGGGGAGQSVNGHALTVTPGETITVVIGAKGVGGNGGLAPGNNGSNGTNGYDVSVTTLLGTFTLTGGTGGMGGAGYGAPSGQFGGGGAPGLPGGFYGTDGALGGAGGNGGPSPFGAAGYGGRGATIGSVPGGNATGNGAGGGGAGSAYQTTSTANGSKGGDGTDGIAILTW